MAELKTRKNRKSVGKFIDDVQHPVRQADARTLLELMSDVTGEKPAMWGDSIVGFGSYHYTYKSGHEGDWFLTGFSPRKANLSIYLMDGFERYEGLLDKLGKHKTAKSCLYITRLDKVDLGVLRELLEESVEHMKQL